MKQQILVTGPWFDSFLSFARSSLEKEDNQYDTRKQVSYWSFLLFIDYGIHWSEWRECWGNYLVWEKLIPQDLNNFGSRTVRRNSNSTSNLPHGIRMRSHHLLRDTALPYPFSPQSNVHSYLFRIVILRKPVSLSFWKRIFLGKGISLEPC